MRFAQFFHLSSKSWPLTDTRIVGFDAKVLAYSSHTRVICSTREVIDKIPLRFLEKGKAFQFYSGHSAVFQFCGFLEEILQSVVVSFKMLGSLSTLSEASQ